MCWNSKSHKLISNQLHTASHSCIVAAMCRHVCSPHQMVGSAPYSRLTPISFTSSLAYYWTVYFNSTLHESSTQYKRTSTSRPTQNPPFLFRSSSHFRKVTESEIRHCLLRLRARENEWAVRKRACKWSALSHGL